MNISLKFFCFVIEYNLFNEVFGFLIPENISLGYQEQCIAYFPLGKQPCLSTLFTFNMKSRRFEKYPCQSVIPRPYK